MRAITSLLLVALCTSLVCPAKAQQPTLSEVYLVWLPDKSQFYVAVGFSQPLKSLPTPNQIRLVAKPSDTPLVASAVEFQVGSQKSILIDWNPSLATPMTDDDVLEASFTGIQFTSGQPQTIDGTGEIYSRTNIQSLDAKRTKEMQEAAAHAKTTEEKNIFAGFSVASPAQGDAEGEAELHLNRWVSPSFFVSFNLRKSSAANADARQFQIGLTWRKVWTTADADIRRIRSSIGELQKARDPRVSLDDLRIHRQNLAKELENLGSKKLLGFMIDGSGRLEGEAMNFNVTNAVLDLPFQVTSRTLRLGGGGGFWKFRLIPAGGEFGYNLRSENMTMTKYTIGRFKVGGVLTLEYHAPDPQRAVPQLIVLDLQAVNRYLFKEETGFDQSTEMAVGVSKGNKPWYQADLKFYLVNTDKGRFGFRVSFIRGQLPPVFSHTRAFKFGTIFETSDDDSSK